jgi:DNA-binding XRE family transcriptional regulator
VLGLDNAAKEHPAVYTGVGALEAGVVSLYAVVIVLMGVYPSRVHKSSLWAGSREMCRLRGAIPLSNTYTVPQTFTSIYKYGKIFTVNYGTVEVDVDTLKELRINAGLSQRELATRAGLTPGAVWQVEHRGSGSPATLKKLADVLGVRPVDLLKQGR